MSKLEDAWPTETPPPDFSGRVLDAWMRERAGEPSTRIAEPSTDDSSAGRGPSPTFSSVPPTQGPGRPTLIADPTTSADPASQTRAALDEGARSRHAPVRSTWRRDAGVFAAGFGFAAAAAIALWFALGRAPREGGIQPEPIATVRSEPTGSAPPLRPAGSTPPGPSAAPSAAILSVPAIASGRRLPCERRLETECKCRPNDPTCDCPVACPDLDIGDPPREKLTAKEVEEIVAAERDGLDECADPTERFPVTAQLELRITRAGSVAGIAVSGVDDHPALAACITLRAAMWRFPNAQNSVTVSVPLVFREVPPQIYPTPTPQPSAS